MDAGRPLATAFPTPASTVLPASIDAGNPLATACPVPAATASTTLAVSPSACAIPVPAGIVDPTCRDTGAGRNRGPDLYRCRQPRRNRGSDGGIDRPGDDDARVQAIRDSSTRLALYDRADHDLRGQPRRLDIAGSALDNRARHNVGRQATGLSRARLALDDDA